MNELTVKLAPEHKFPPLRRGPANSPYNINCEQGKLILLFIPVRLKSLIAPSTLGNNHNSVKE